MFEDAEYVSISQLILKKYRSDQAIFAGGNANIYNTIKSKCNAEDEIVVLFGISPEILTLLQVFMSERSKVMDSEYKNVFFVPIPCIEYFVLKEFAYEYLDNQTKDILDFKIHYKEYNQYKKIKSFEHVCKHLLDVSIDCLSTKVDEPDFYIQDCDCTSCNHKFMKGSLNQKAERLTGILPVHIITVEKSTNNQNDYLNSLQEKYIESYNKWVKKSLQKGLIKWDTSINI